MTQTKHCLITPKKYRYITGILPNMKKIEGPMELDLNIKEIKRCMMNGALVQILDDGSQIPLDERNYHIFSTDEQDIPVLPPGIELEDIARVGYAKVGKAIII